MFGENNWDNFFYSTVYGCPISVNPAYVAKLLWILQEADGIKFSTKLTPGEKGDLIDPSVYTVH